MDFTAKLFKVYERFSEECPFYFEILQKCSFVADHQQESLMRLDVIEGRFYIYYHPDRWQKLSYDDLAIQLEHQILHVIFKHNIRGEFKDKKLFHTACDMIVNHNIQRVRDNYPTILMESNNHFMFNAPLIPLLFEDDEFCEKFGTSHQINQLTVEKLYNFLESKANTWTPDCASIDEVEFEISENEKAVLNAMVREIYKKLGTSIGWGIEPGIEKLLVKMAQPAKRDYWKIVKLFVGELKGDRKKSWSRINRRHPNQVAGKTRDNLPLLCVVIDTSGSMKHEKIMRNITSELLALKKVVKGIYVVAGDTEITFAKKFQTRMDVNQIEFIGFGGTNLQFGWDFAKKNKCDGVICYTDGAIGNLDTLNLPSFFVLTVDRFLDNDKFREFMATVMELDRW